MASDAELEQQLLGILETYGGTGGNISLQKDLDWEPDEYWRIRNRLIEAGKLVLGRGKGGSVRLVRDEVIGDGVAPPSPAPAPEAELYDPIAKTLVQWASDKPRFVNPIIVITAKQGKRSTGGTWSRPDLTLIAVTTYRFVPNKQLDIVTFEVKTPENIDIQAVYEALAHRRASTRSFVVVYLPKEPDVRDELGIRLQAVYEEAERYGVGVITVGNPAEYETWDEQVPARRVEPRPERLDEFIAVQMDDEVKGQILKLLH